jgi:hypothetical protein
MQVVPTSEEERGFGEFRRKVRDSELLSASLQKLLSSIHFTGRVSVVGAEWPRAEIRLRGGLLPESR